MCMGGGGSPKVEVPKPPPLPPPIPAPPPPKPPKTKPKMTQVIQKQDLQKPDIRIGASKGTQRPSTGRPRTQSVQQGIDSLSIGSNQGMNL